MKKQKDLFKPILLDALLLTWRRKTWWIFGFLALFLSGTMGYQIVFQGIRSLVQPEQWWVRWETWAQGLSPFELISAQGKLLLADPKGWFAMLFVWGIIFLVLLLLLAVCSYAAIALISVVKIRQIEQSEDHLFLALREAFLHVKPVVGAVLLVQFLANLLIILFSIPVIWIGVDDLNLVQSGMLLFFLALFFFSAFVLSSMAIYTIQHIVYQDLSLSDAIVASWKLFWRHWLLTLEMFLIQLFIGVLALAGVFLLISLITVPVTIVGFILVSNQLFDITTYLPQTVFYLIMLLSVIMGAVYTVFYLYSWTMLFSRFDEVRPHSRFAQFIEIHLLR